MTNSAAHKHGPNCGHTAVRHGDHVDYLDDGHLHHLHDGHVHEHITMETRMNKAGLRILATRCHTDSTCSSRI